MHDLYSQNGLPLFMINFSDERSFKRNTFMLVARKIEKTFKMMKELKNKNLIY